MDKKLSYYLKHLPYFYKYYGLKMFLMKIIEKIFPYRVLNKVIILLTYSKKKRLNLYRKRVNLNKCIKNCKKPKLKISNTPLEIYIEVSRDCNINCIMCARTFDSRYKSISGRNMSMKIFNKIIPILPGLVKVHAFGNGEPLLNKNFIKMNEIIKSFDVHVEFNTNGVLLDKKKSEEIVKVGLDSITFSFDAAKKKTYENIRRGAIYEKVIDNIKKLNDIKKKFNKTNPRITFAIVGMKQNITEIPDIIKLAKDLRVKSVYVEPLLWQDYSVYEKFFHRQSLSNINQDKVQKIMETGKNLANKFGISFTSPLLEVKDYEFIIKEKPQSIMQVKVRDKLFCTQPWTTIFIDWDGKVHPCCGTEEVFGNLNNQSFKEIFNNEKFISLRKSIINNKIIGYCKNCVKNKRNKNTLPEISNILQI